MKNPFARLDRFERILWITSVIVIALCTVLSPQKDFFSLVASLIGVTALIFIAKGYVIGQCLIIIFASLYGIISLEYHYYGEVITYMGMSAPMAIVSIIQWIKHPYKDSAQVKVARLSASKIILLVIASIVVTVVFRFILEALGTANLIASTLSVATSFLAASLTALRSPYYALSYAMNDIVLIALWIMASTQDLSYLAMVVCFVVFLANDIYGFINWRRMGRWQEMDG